MSTPLRSIIFMALCSIVVPDTGAANQVTAAAIEAAIYQGGDLPGGQSALTAKVQVMLDRAGVSPGVIDGIRGGMSRSAIAAFERRSGLPADGVMDAQVWVALQPFAGGAMVTDYTITQADAGELTQYIPTDYLEKANMTTLGYTSVAEKLGERFHMDEKFISALNPGVPLSAGSTIKVIAPSKPLRAKVASIFVEKGTNRVAAYDSEGHMVVNYPATIGSSETPSPSGTHKVRAVAMNPEYTYNPAINFTQGENTSVLTLPPGPNGPVGTVWIALTKPTYGLHGTATPSRLFVNESHGCVRLTNWDAEELAHMVQPGVTTVEFLEKGTSLADVMGEAKGVSKAVQAAGTAVSPVAAGIATLKLVTSAVPVPRPAHMVQPVPTAVVPAATAVPSVSVMPTGPVSGTVQPDSPAMMSPVSTEVPASATTSDASGQMSQPVTPLSGMTGMNTVITGPAGTD